MSREQTADRVSLPSPRAGASRAVHGTHARYRGRTDAYGRWAVWFFRLLLLTPFVLMGPEVVSAIRGRPDGVAHVSASTADVLGTSTLLIFVMMLSVTPINTVTGWRWHLVLRRDYGIAMFASAAMDLTLAAITTGDTFPGGVLARVGGHTFLVAGLLSTLLLVPMVVTANRRAQRWLGGYWKRIQQLTYVVWVTVLIHLLFLFGVGTIFINAVAVSLPLVVLRIPAVRRRWRSARRTGSHRVVRAVLAVALIGLFAAGYVPLAHELATKGGAAFTQSPADD
jgi:sulfoxide reductase heme-binding subunit YedZ